MSNKKHKCNKCGLICRDKSDLKRHMNRKNPCELILNPENTNMTYCDKICRYCQRTFASKYSVKRHYNNCSAKKLFDADPRGGANYKKMMQSETKVKKLKNKIKKLNRDSEKSNKVNNILLDKSQESSSEDISLTDSEESSDLQLSNFGYVYIIQLREFVNSGENTYKIGRSGREFPFRICSYPKKSEMYLSIRTHDNVVAESHLKQIFSKKFIQRSDYGTEYFQGDVESMVKTMSKFVWKFNSKTRS